MINSIIFFSIKNKVAIWIFVVALIIGGLYSMTRIPLDAVPDITNNQVLVITTAPNLGTEDIEQLVTYQVELSVSNLPGVEEIRSVSRFGLSVVTIVFKDNMGTYLPRQLINEALNEIKEKIPSSIAEPFIAPISSGLGEIYQYTLEVQEGYDTVYNDMDLRTIQDWIVKRQMAMLPGVVEVNTFGGRLKQYEVAVNPDRLKSMGLTIIDIFEALEKNNQNVGGAYIEKDHQANFIRGEGLMRSINDIENTLVKTIDNQPVFIRDVANVKFGNFLRYGAFTKDGKGEAVGGIVMMLKGENSNDVIKRVKKRVELIQKSLPDGVVIKPFLDRSKLIKSTTSTVAENLSIGALIVIFILVLFLGNVRGGLIVASTIPLALLFAFVMMHLFGVWANLMSLGAIDFGILVDGAVIITESMIFYLSGKNIGVKLNQQERDNIAYEASSKMMNSAFFGQVIILIVFIPLVFLYGIEGKMFKPMAMTFSFAIIGVIILCLTYIPMMTATFLKPTTGNKKTIGDKIIIILEQKYKPIINLALKRSKGVIIFAILLLILGAVVFFRMGAVFMPQLDEGDIAFQEFYKPGTSLSEVIKTTTKIEKIVMEDFPDEVESIQSRIGVADLPTDPMPMDIADVFVILKPKDQWTKVNNKKELIEEIKEKISIITGINIEFSQPIEMRFNELLTGIREDVAIKLYGDNLEILSDKAQEIVKLIANVEGVAGIKAEAMKGLPQITIRYDRNRLGQYGIDIRDINKLIETAFSGTIAGTIYEGEKMFDLVVRLDEEYRDNIDDIRNIFVTLDDGQQIPLNEVADIDYKSGPMQISRDNTNRRTYVGINVEGRDVKSLVKEIQSIIDNKLVLPSGYYIRYGGAFENLDRASKRLVIVVPIALVLIFLLVFFAVKSIKQTLIIYIAIPLSAVGGVLSLWLRDMPFSISAGVGFIVLFGVAILNGLVLINGFNEMRNSKKYSLQDTIVKGSIRRIRPILLTATTDILGFLPMAISVSAGAEIQRPLATVVIGGMLTSTLLTLVVLPVLYKLVYTKKNNNKTNRQSVIVASVMFLMLLFVPSINNAQPIISIEQAVDTALSNYPSIKVSELQIDKQQAMKNTFLKFGSTTIYTGKEEVGNNSLGINNRLGIQQDNIDVFSFGAEKKIINSQTKQAKAGLNLTQAQLKKMVCQSYYNAVYYKKQWLLLKKIDTVYENFEKAAKLRYETQQTSKIAYLSASAKYNELKLKIKRIEGAYEASLLLLNQYLMNSEKFDVDATLNYERILFQTDTIKNNPELEYYLQGIDVAKQKWKKEKTSLYPKINVSYTLQSINNNQGYYAWQAGVTLPLVFFSQAGKIKAAKIDYSITEQQFAQKQIELQSRYSQLYKKYITIKDILEYYISSALPLAKEQIEATNLAYKLGSIDYVQFIQNTETAINTSMQFYKQENEFLLLYAELEYLSGK